MAKKGKFNLKSKGFVKDHPALFRRCLKKMRSRKLHPDTIEPLNQKGLKHTDCPFYLECLSYAVNQRWDYWSCGKCENHMLGPVYERLQFIEEYYPILAQIYPEFRRKYERFI